MEIHYYFHTTDIQSKYKHTVQAEESQLRETALTARTTFAYQRKFVQTHVNKNQILRPLPHHCTADTLHEEEQIFTCQEIQTGILLPTFTFLPTSGTWECVSHEDFLNI